MKQRQGELRGGQRIEDGEVFNDRRLRAAAKVTVERLRYFAWSDRRWRRRNPDRAAALEETADDLSAALGTEPYLTCENCGKALEPSKTFPGHFLACCLPGARKATR